ncbi:unnamed protein product [Chrysoparadoxa australica]
MSTPPLPPQPYNLLLFVSVVVLVIWGTRVVKRLGQVLSLGTGLRSRRLVGIRGLGHRVFVLRNLAPSHLQALVHSRQAQAPEIVPQIPLDVAVNSVKCVPVGRLLGVTVEMTSSQPCYVHLMWDVEPSAIETQALSKLAKEVYEKGSDNLGSSTHSQASWSRRNMVRVLSGPSGSRHGGLSAARDAPASVLCSKASRRWLVSGEANQAQANGDAVLPSTSLTTLAEEDCYFGCESTATASTSMGLMSEVVPPPAPLPKPEDSQGAGRHELAVVITLMTRQSRKVWNDTRMATAVSLVLLVSLTPDSSAPGGYSPSVTQQLLLVDESDSAGGTANTNGARQGGYNMYTLGEVYGVGTAQECVICLTGVQQCILLPCRHLCVCGSCFKHIDKCPVCRCQFDKYMKCLPRSSGHVDTAANAGAIANGNSTASRAAVAGAVEAGPGLSQALAS